MVARLCCPLQKLVTESLILRHERQRKVGSYILGYLERELSLLNEGDVHNASSDPIESTFGVTKDRMSNDKLTGVTPMILIMPLRIALADKTGELVLILKNVWRKEDIGTLKNGLMQTSLQIWQ